VRDGTAVFNPLFLALRVDERFKLAPGTCEAMDAGRQATLLAYELLRQVQERADARREA